ncbi:MAG: diguanylate cyclase, partial [Mesorhizobium sp.]
LAREKAVRVAERVLERLRIKVPAPNGDIQVGCTVGVAIYPTEAADPDALVALADRLMYVGKKEGRGRLVTSDQLALEQSRASGGQSSRRQRRIA